MASLRVGPLVRAVSATSVNVWAECTHAGLFVCSAHTEAVEENMTLQVSAHTVTVGGRFYVVAQLQNLQPGTWYRYQCTLSADNEELFSAEEAGIVTADRRYCLRTLDEERGDAFPQPALRIAYGSCRRGNLPQFDTLNVFGDWLNLHREQRETQWPHMLLLIGDQIYADTPPDEIIQRYPHLLEGAGNFADFAILYEYAWTENAGVRQVLANIPTFMIFDDHEIIGNWCNEEVQKACNPHAGKEQLLVDGLVAYWVYQGWGNLDQGDAASHPLLGIMKKAALTGTDALDTLRRRIKTDVDGTEPLCWHYKIPSVPAVFVTNARTGRSEAVPNRPEVIYEATHILSREQMLELQRWLQEHDQAPALVVSSVPLLLPPAIGLAEYVIGWRVGLKMIAPLRWLGYQIAGIQQKIANRLSFDHWPLYHESWHALRHSVRDRTNDILVLSGDVHFSYAMVAHHQRAHQRKARLYQFVASPFQNSLNPSDQRLVRLQAILQFAGIGGLQTCILPLKAKHKAAQITANILFQNTLALVTIQSDAQKFYTLQQEYLGVVDGQLQSVGYTVLPG